ncbi:predicted protein [Plenodomus lingam JN3]|uniref:Predicted protein n=1 Tax=Leptosphaeria maculans (strain JN3 / isolate v23.1.3 / race Av1-4-5-6-7-8) TaxID=985895 RepID=E4ZIA3_LEPMJ|nr:predicted protein [Plenodomus lingam JN3]CBX90764.1 predicted protein [Plenodomus lingam JN3]
MVVYVDEEVVQATTCCLLDSAAWYDDTSYPSPVDTSYMEASEPGNWLFGTACPIRRLQCQQSLCG